MSFERLRSVVAGTQDAHPVELHIGELEAESLDVVILPGVLHGGLQAAGGDRFQLAGGDAGDEENQGGDLHPGAQAAESQAGGRTNQAFFGYLARPPGM